MITSDVPASWQELEAAVARILDRSGLTVEHPKHLETVRGGVDIDVFAVQLVDGRAVVVLCECKNWNRPVPQEVVYAFRSVMADSGAHIGYVISARGFQTGA